MTENNQTSCKIAAVATKDSSETQHPGGGGWKLMAGWCGGWKPFNGQAASPTQCPICRHALQVDLDLSGGGPLGLKPEKVGRVKAGCGKVGCGKVCWGKF